MHTLYICRCSFKDYRVNFVHWFSHLLISVINLSHICISCRLYTFASLMIIRLTLISLRWNYNRLLCSLFPGCPPCSTNERCGLTFGGTACVSPFYRHCSEYSYCGPGDGWKNEENKKYGFETIPMGCCGKGNSQPSLVGGGCTTIYLGILPTPPRGDW